MTDDSSISHRRKVLKQLAAGLSLTSLAGCAEDQQDNPVETTETASPTASDTQTETGTAEIKTSSPTHSETSEKTPTETSTETLDPISIFELETKTEPGLPGVWTEDHDLNNFETVLQVTAQTQNSTPIGETIVEDNDNDIIGSWEGNTPTIQKTTTQGIQKMQDGKNSYTAKNTKHDLEAEATAETQLPDNFLLDLQPANTENNDSTIFTTYSSTQEFSHDKKEIDLNQLEEWHDNDFENLSETHPKMQRFVEGVGDDSKLIDVKQFEEDDSELDILYPNWQESEYYGGHFEKETYEGAGSAGEALDWLQPLLFNYEEKYTDDGAISTEDEQYAAIFQECFDEYNDKFDTHVWSFDLESSNGGTHGNGFIYDSTNDELRILETIRTPVTAEVGEKQYHSLVGNSNYLNPEHDAFQQYWHPLRFDGTNPEPDYISFEDAKVGASAMFRGITTGFDDNDINETHQESGTALTTNYLEDVVETIRSYNMDDEFDFETLKNQSKAYNKLYSEEGNYLIGGSVEKPVYAELDNEEKAREALEDPEGTLINYVDDLEQDSYDQITVADADSGRSPSQIPHSV
jgi:hypothetical protein